MGGIEELRAPSVEEPDAGKGLHRYVEVVKSPGVLPLATSSLIGRLAIGMMGLGIVLLCRAEGLSYGLAGLYAGMYALGVALSAPIVGRSIDRFGAPVVLGPEAVCFPLAVAGFVVAVKAELSPGWLVLLAILCGTAIPPLAPCMRALWPQLLAPRLRETGYTLEAVMHEVAFTGGPVLVAALAIVSSSAALFVAAAFAGTGALAFAALSARRGRLAIAAGTARTTPLLDSRVRALLLATLAVGITFGAMEVAIPAFSERHGHRAAAGILLGLWSLGSIIGGFWAGARAFQQTARRRHRVALALFACLMVPLLLPTSIPLMAVLIALAGLPIAPAFAATFVLLDELTPAETATEVFGWTSTAVVAGVAIGNTVGGAAVNASGYRAGLLVAIAAAVVGVGLALVRRAQ